MNYCFLTIGSWENNTIFMRFRELGRELALRGHNVSYIVDDLPGNREDTLRVAPGTSVYRVAKGGFISQTLQRRRLLRTIKADAVHILNTSPKTFAATIFRGDCKLVGDWDEWPARRTGFPKHRMIIDRILDVWQRNCSDVCVVCSAFMQEEFAKLGTKAAYIPYAAYLPDRPTPPSPFSEPTLVYLGALHRIWDHGILFHALKILKDRGKSYPCCFMGGGPEQQQWRDFVRQEGLENVRVMGFVPDDPMWAHLRHAQALLFPIRRNIINLSRCPAKAFAYAQARRPVITCRVGEVPPVLGDGAIYVDEATPEAFADAMQKVMDQPRLEDVDYHVEKQNWSDRTERLLECFKGKGC